MQGFNQNKDRFWGILFVLIPLIVICFYYYWLIHETVFYHSNVDLFDLYAWAIASLGAVTILRVSIRQKISRDFWPVYTIYLATILSVLFFHYQLKPMPCQLRFSVSNRTGSDLTGVRVIGAQELRLKDIRKGENINFRISDYKEDADINMIAMIKGGWDTFNLANVMNNSCGYFYEVELKAANDNLAKYKGKN